MSATKKILVYGGTGALGDTLVAFFKAKNNWVVSIDLKENEKADASIVVNASDSFLDQEKSIDLQLHKLLNQGVEKLDAIFNVAGGWAGGNAAAKDFLANSDLMWRQSVWSSLISAALSSRYLKEHTGLLTLTGAAAALNTAATPGMIGYGVAKAAVHQLTKSLADPKGGMPEGTFVGTIMPITLDTPMNRKWMPKADMTTWTPMPFVAELFDKWLNDAGSRPSNGTLVKLETVNSETKLVLDN